MIPSCDGQHVRIPSPFRLLLAVLATVFSIEMLVMVALTWLRPIPSWGEDVLDASSLALILFPVVYFLVYRPLVETIHHLERANECGREHEARLGAMLDNLPSMAWLMNADGKYLAANKKFAAACGKADAAEVVGKTSCEVCPDWMLESFCDDDETIMASGRQTLTEVHTPGGGEHQWLEVYRNPILDAQGKVLGITGYVRDITARRKSEEQMRLTAKIVEKSHDSIIITEKDGTIISVNPAFTEITGYTAEEVIGRNPRILNSGRQEPGFYQDMWTSLLQDGYWDGEVWNRCKSGAHYAGRLAISALRDESGSVTHYVGVTSDITEFKLAQDRVRHLAYYDQLTGLPNGSLMRDRVSELIATSQRDLREFALLIVDIDNFKNINDSLGHHIGDLILQTLAGRLKGVVRDMDTVARMGGDEFVLVIPGASAEGARQVARKVIGHVTNTVGIGLHKISMTASVGIGLYPKDGRDLESIIKNAELALYQAKAKGKNDFAFFREELNVIALERLRLENDLRNALLNEELILYYQPQISTKTREVVGLEALVRWPHARLNMIPPDQFIPIAEDSDLIVQLGEWSIHEACRQMRQWQRAGVTPLPVAVNVSPRHMRHEGFFDSVESALRKTGLDPRYLELELTERAVITDVDNAVDIMNRVGSMGVRFSMDDFGTGHSSLAYLKHLPINKLKIDKAFVRDIVAEENDREISNTIIQLAHGLHLTVVAEGVETPQQMAILMRQGCDIAQGYLFSRPLPTLETAAYLRAAQAA